MMAHTNSNRTRISYPLYFGGLATMFCGLAALNSVLADSHFLSTTGTLFVMGYVCSIALRKLGYTARFIELIVVASALAIYGRLVLGQSVSDLVIPSAAEGAEELKLAAMLLWLEVLRSFTLVSDESVVFSAVPSVVLISLVATNNVNPEIMAIFIVYLMLAAFLLCHRVVQKRSELRPVFKVAIVVASLALILGSLAVVPIRSICAAGFAAAMPGFAHIKQRFSLAGYADGNFLQIAQGPIRLSEATVMTVDSRILDSKRPVGAYWRGRVFDRYTGRGWQVSADYEQVSPTERPDAIAITEGAAQFGKLSPKTKGLLHQTFRIRAAHSRTVFAASEPLAVFTEQDELERNGFNCWQRTHQHNHSTAHDRRTLYSVVSKLPVRDPHRLRRAGMDYPDDIRKYFLQRVTSTADVGSLAKRITARIDNPYDKAQAICLFLARRCSYDLNAPPVPPGADAVSYFLFTSRLGYCDVFASAMVMMCREVGVPARLATGFSTGEYDNEIKRFRVRDMDRHAWAEVYFPGCGWISFDPTGLTDGNSETWIVLARRHAARFLGQLFGGPAALPVVVIVVLTCAAVAFGPEIRRIKIRRRAISPSRLHSAALARWNAIRRTLGVTDSGATPIEAARLADLRSDQARKAAIDAAELFSRIRYGNLPVTPPDVSELSRLHNLVRRRESLSYGNTEGQKHGRM